MTDPTAHSVGVAPGPALGRWWQLSLGVICMSMIANLQYGWVMLPQLGCPAAVAAN
jgi:hypothetical protein